MEVLDEQSADALHVEGRIVTLSCAPASIRPVPPWRVRQFGDPLHPGERLNCATHGLGLALSLFGAVWLALQAADGGNPWRLAGACIFGIAMVTTYLASMLFHALRGRAKARWATLDHCAIYLLIAGTYTPFAMAMLRGPARPGLLAAVWGLAALGIVRELGRHPPDKPSWWLYLAMGWAGVVAAVPLASALPGDGAWLLLAGALLYSVGLVFYVGSDRWRHAHGVWHLFVLAGSGVHFATVARFVV